MDSGLDSLYRAFSCCWYAWQGPRWSAARRRAGDGDAAGDGGAGPRGAVGDGGIQEEGGGGCGGIGGGACEGIGGRGGGGNDGDDDEAPSSDTTGARIRYEALSPGGGGGGGVAGGGCDRSEEILHLLRHSFFREEALVSSGGSSWASGAAGGALLPALAHRLLRQGVSVAAVEEESGRVVGIAVNVIVRGDDPATHPYRLLQDHLTPDRHSKLHEVAHFLRDLHAGQFERPPGARAGTKDLCVLLLNVERHYAGRGIGRELLARSVSIARAARAQRVVGNATGDAAPRLYEHHGFRATGEMRASAAGGGCAREGRPQAAVVARLYVKDLAE